MNILNLYPSQKYELLKVFFITTLLIVSVTSSYLYLTTKPKNLIIAVEDGRIQVIDQENIPSKEIFSFLEMFLNETYSYSYLTLKNNLDKSSNLMSEALWDEKRSQIQNMIEKLSTEKISSKLKDITALTKINDSEYLTEIIQEIVSHQKKIERKIKLKIYVNKKTIRTKENPSRYEVLNYEEI